MARPASITTSSSSTVFDAESALHALDDGYCVLGADWRVLFANAAFARIFHLAPSELTGCELWTVLPGLAATTAGESLRAAMRDGRTRSCSAEYRDSRLRGVYDFRAVRYAEAGLAVQVADVSHVTHADRELLERSEENESLRQVARALAEETDSAAILRRICREAAVGCGGTGAAVIELGERAGEVVAAVGMLEPILALRLQLAGSLAERAIERRDAVRTTDYPSEFGHHGWATVGATIGVGPLLVAPLIAHGEILGVLTVARPRGLPGFGEREDRRVRGIADHAALALWKSRLFEQVQNANRAKTEFIATMSHELRTPLTALTGYEELLSEGILGPVSAEQLNALERMRSSTQLLSTIIEEVLTFSRLEAGQEPVRPADTTAHEILDTVAAVLEPLASSKPVELRVVRPGAPLRLRTDPDMVRRILVNLGANAIKFTPRGVAEITVAAGEDQLRFVVRDTGIGILEEDFPRLFQPFTQLDSGFTRRFGGTGLGLYTARRLARLLGGDIILESEPGRGSTFTLVTPARFPG